MRRLALLLALLALAAIAPTAEAKGARLDLTVLEPLEGAPGESVEAKVAIENSGDAPADVHVHLHAGMGSGLASAYFPPARVAPGASVVLQGWVNVSRLAEPGTHGAWLFAQANEPAEAWTPVRVAVGGAPTPEHRIGYAISPARAVVEAEAGADATAVWRVHNADAGWLFVNLTLGPLPEGWTATPPTERIDVPARSHVDVEIPFHAAPDAPGEAIASLWITERPESSFAMFSSLVLRANGGRAVVEAALDPPSLDLAPGEAGRLTLRLGNHGLIPRGVEIAATSVGDAALDVSPANAGFSMGSGENRDVVLDVRMPDDARADGRVLVVVRDGGGPIELLAAVRLRAPPPAGSDATLTAAEGFALAAAGVGAGAVGVVVANRRWGLAFAALYARLRPSRVMEHETRRAVLAAVRAEPGITMSDLQRRLGLANGRMRHHLAKLASARVVSITRDGNRRRLWPVEERAPQAGSLPERALARLRAGRVPMRQLARDLNVSPQALHYHLKRLHAEGAVVARLESGRLVVEVPP
ncbi:MAG TPA: winged helix-turn-helix transcriptional regulator [Candidatus Thermoplasmatota archaeon]|nr:winged helix-turn-helix transcriptional regulator [Candidatus Thermoplasmatota archaeon]